jgi:hypothetical protein
LHWAAAVRGRALQQFAIVAVGLAGEEALASQADLETFECIVEAELMVAGFKVAGLAVGQVAELELGQG